MLLFQQGDGFLVILSRLCVIFPLVGHDEVQLVEGIPKDRLAVIEELVEHPHKGTVDLCFAVPFRRTLVFAFYMLVA